MFNRICYYQSSLLPPAAQCYIAVQSCTKYVLMLRPTGSPCIAQIAFFLLRPSCFFVHAEALSLISRNHARLSATYNIAPLQVKAAIVTCGGLCPGLNNVIRETVDTLWYNYGVSHIVGVQNGYWGEFHMCFSLISSMLDNALGARRECTQPSCYVCGCGNALTSSGVCCRTRNLTLTDATDRRLLFSQAFFAVGFHTPDAALNTPRSPNAPTSEPPLLTPGK